MLKNKDALFSEFNATTKNQWLARIEKDLKGRPISELNWLLTNPSKGSDAIIIDSFAHAEDFNGRVPEPIIGGNIANTWGIGEHIEVKKSDFKIANKQALSALMGGVNTPHFIFDIYPTPPQLATLLEDIELDYIITYFSEKSKTKNPLVFLRYFRQLALDKGKNPKILRGGIFYDPFADGRHEVKSMSELLLWIKEYLPLFKVITVDGGSFFKGSENVVAELGQTLKAGENYLKRLTNAGIVSPFVAEKMQFQFHIDTYYFIEIAKIRAFKILWGNVLSAYNAPNLCTDIHAIIAPNTQGEDSHTNKIRATTQAMSAVLGGVNSLTIAPSDVKISENDDFNRRIARNVQHLLLMESYFDRVADPAAGSYYIEQLTTQIAEAAWVYFQEIVDK
jgi:methylmalonyl-CoA mutase